MPQGRFHPEPLRHPFHPGFFAEGAAPLHAHSKRLQLRCRLRAIHARQPSRGRSTGQSLSQVVSLVSL